MEEKKILDENKPTLEEAIRSQAREDERPNSASLSLRKILGGDFLTAEVLRRQIWVVLLIVIFAVVYVANRYNVQQDMIRIDALKKELVNAKYRSLAASSQLTEKCRESNVQKMMKQGPDSAVYVSDQPPFIIRVPEEEKLTNTPTP